MIKKKKNILLLIFSLFILGGSFPKRVFAANCTEFSTAVTSSSVTVTINNCDTDGNYLLQIVKNDEVVVADSVSVNAGQAQKIFHLSEKGSYLARLIFAANIIKQSSFTIQNLSTLNCGDPCNPNDLNCPSQCPSTYINGRWVCYLRPASAAESSGGIDFGQLSGAIPSLKPIFQPGPSSNVGGIISTVLPYLYVIAGLLLLFYLIYGGFHMMTAANDEKGLVEAKGKITNALVGFLLLFVSYWIVQIMEYILGIQIF